jgi:rhodanese-related sulfurtransferase
MFDRLPRRDDPQRVPRPTDDDRGLFVVDATWGKIAPLSLGSGVRTVGELEVMAHLRAGGRAVDTRQDEYVAASGALPGAVAIPHEDVVARREEWDDGGGAVVFYCNGPQCTATPQAIKSLLEAGFPADRILYYRGGIHDWMTLGLPLTAP